MGVGGGGRRGRMRVGHDGACHFSSVNFSCTIFVRVIMAISINQSHTQFSRLTE